MGRRFSFLNVFGFPPYSTFGPIMSVGMGGLLIYLQINLKKEFRFYHAKTCFMVALHGEDVFKQMYYFGLGLQEYDKYLKRHLKHQIKDIDKIFSKGSLLDNYTRTKKICLISDSFKTENDKLKPLKHISSELMKSEDIESFFDTRILEVAIKGSRYFSNSIDSYRDLDNWANKQIC